MATANIVVTDTHCGSRYGICPESVVISGDKQGVTFGEGDTHGLNPMQKYLWDCWQHAWDIWLPQEIGDLQRVVWDLGDSIEGVHHGGSSLVSPEASDHAAGAIALKKERYAGAVKRIMISGTEAHAGKAGEGDNGVAEKVGAEPDPLTGRFARWEAWESVDGVLVHAAHHIRGSYVPSSDMTPLVGEYLEMSDACTAYGWPMPRIILRGHSHKPRMYPHGQCVVIACPGFQAKTPFAFKQKRGRPAAIGITVFITHEGQFDTPIIKEYAWPKPTIGVIGWQPDKPATAANQDQDLPASNSQTGFLFSMKSRVKQLTGR
jgi:hypothetical protein